MKIYLSFSKDGTDIFAFREKQISVFFQNALYD
jgi:hypothetical protein